MCNIGRFYSLRELYEADFYKQFNPESMETGQCGLTRVGRV